VFTPTHDAFWAAARQALGDSAGTRVLVEVLLLHRHLEQAHVLTGVSAALSVGSVNADVVAVEARKAAQRRRAAPTPIEATPRTQQVVRLTERRLATCPAMTGRCPRSRPTTTCSERPAHERDDEQESAGHPAWRHRTGRARRDRLRHPRCSFGC